MIPESSLVVLFTLVLAFDGLTAPLMRYWRRRDRRDAAVLAWVFFPAIAVLLVGSAMITSVGIGVLFLLSTLVVCYNRWYIGASEDELAEGVIWPIVREVILEQMNERETQVHIQIE